MVFLFKFFIFVHDVLLISALSISVGFCVPETVDFGLYTLMYVVLSMGMYNNFGYLPLIWWSTGKGNRFDGRSTLVLSLYMYFGFKYIGAYTVILDMTLGYCK